MTSKARRIYQTVLLDLPDHERTEWEQYAYQLQRFSVPYWDKLVRETRLDEVTNRQAFYAAIKASGWSFYGLARRMYPDAPAVTKDALARAARNLVNTWLIGRQKQARRGKPLPPIPHALTTFPYPRKYFLPVAERTFRLVGTSMILRVPDYIAVSDSMSSIRLHLKDGRFAMFMQYYIAPPVSPEAMRLSRERIAGIDLGIRNLITVVGNRPDFTPFAVNGLPLKRVWHRFAKERAAGRLDARKRMHREARRYMVLAAEYTIARLVSEQVGKIALGDIRSRHIPPRRLHSAASFAYLKTALKLLAEEVGIVVVMVHEAYTSLSSFLDGDDPTATSHVFSGQRVSRGLYRSSTGLLINADVNASYQIVRRCCPKAFEPYPYTAFPLHPQKITMPRYASPIDLRFAPNVPIRRLNLPGG